MPIALWKHDRTFHSHTSSLDEGLNDTGVCPRPREPGKGNRAQCEVVLSFKALMNDDVELSGPKNPKKLHGMPIGPKRPHPHPFRHRKPPEVRQAREHWLSSVPFFGPSSQVSPYSASTVPSPHLGP